MRVLLKEVKVINTDSPYHNQQVDIRIQDGIIHEIGSDLNPIEDENVLQFQDAHVSNGFFDIGALACDPGYEHREDLNSLSRAAAAGGYTGVAVFPNTHPCTHSKADILYVRHQGLGAAANLHPIGAVSENCEGKEITEMLDMQAAGAVAFSDGIKSLQSNGLMLRALLYVKSFGGLVINRPLDYSVAGSGQIHESITSTMMGMRGIPNLAEELMVSRDIYLLEYTASRIHLSGISTEGSVALIRKAKAKGLNITADVPIANLLFTDKAIESFDTNYKVSPPLRGETDRQALIEGFLDGTIDLVTSNHQPWDEEGKKLEFAYAEYGMTGLETTFSKLWSLLEGQISIDKLVERLSKHPRQLLGLPTVGIDKGAKADLVVFSPSENWTYAREKVQSKSLNSPLLGETLQTKVQATLLGDQIFTNPF